MEGKSVGILFIGSIQWGRKNTGGGVQTKNQHLLHYLENKFKECSFYDTYKKNSIVALILSLFSIVKSKKDTIVLLSIAYRGAYNIKMICDLFGVKRRFFYLVPGGDFGEFLFLCSDKKKQIFRSFEMLLVQAQYLKSEMKEMGFINVMVLPNFKPIIFQPPIRKEKGEIFKFVYLSRIKKDKGVDEIIEAIKQMKREDISIDFYGSILEPYSEQQFTKLGKYKIYYKGFLDLSSVEGYNILSQYDAFLFPTYFNGEGFPGALLDSFIAGVPVIATDFHANGEIIISGENGILIPIKDVISLRNSMMLIADDWNMACRLRKGAIQSAYKYEINSVLDKFFNQFIQY